MSLSTSRRNSSGSIPAAIASTAPCHVERVVPTTGLHHIREPAVSKVFSQGTHLHEHPAVYQHARIHLQHTKDLAAAIRITRLLHINASKRL